MTGRRSFSSLKVAVAWPPKIAVKIIQHHVQELKDMGNDGEYGEGFNDALNMLLERLGVPLE